MKKKPTVTMNYATYLEKLAVAFKHGVEFAKQRPSPAGLKEKS